MTARSLGEQLPDRSDKMNEVLQITAAHTEIEEFSHQLESFGLTLSDIADNCPRQERTMDACMKVLDYAKSHPQLLVQMIHSKKLPLAQLAAGSGTERKPWNGTGNMSLPFFWPTPMVLKSSEDICSL